MIGEYDIVIHVNNSIQLGITAKPRTYRVEVAPSFIPRLAVGDPRGVDFGLWRSFVQDDFSGGAGQIRYSEQQGNNRYAEGELIRPTVPQITLSRTLADPTGTVIPRGTEAQGAIQLDSKPTTNSILSSVHALFFTGSYPIFVVATSQAVHLWHNRHAQVLTNIANDVIGRSPVPEAPILPNPPSFIDSFLDIRTDLRKGVWAPVVVSLGGSVTAVARHSSVTVVGLGAAGIVVYGPSTVSHQSIITVPDYSTIGSTLLAFNNALYRTHRHELTRLTPTQITTGVFSYWNNIGTIDPEYNPVLKSVVFNNRMFFGTASGLFQSDGSSITPLYPFDAQTDNRNFAFLKVYNGALYFNIRNKIVRYTSGGAIEVLDLPDIGYPRDATEFEGDFYILAIDGVGILRSWVFNSETGSIRLWFDLTKHRAASSKVQLPVGIEASLGRLILAPYTYTGYSSSTGQISLYTSQLENRENLSEPWFAPVGSLVTSELDMGYPFLEKLWGQVKLSYDLQAQTKIRVYYTLGIEKPAVKQIWTVNPSGAFSNVTQALTDGDFTTSTAVLTTALEEVYFGFSKPIRTFDIRGRLEDLGAPQGGPPGSGTPSGSLLVETFGASPPFKNQPDTAFNPIGALLVYGVGPDTWTSIEPASVIWPIAQTLPMKWVGPGVTHLPLLPGWVPNTVNNVTAYYLRFSTNTNGGVSTVAVSDIRPYATALSEAAWNFLGEVVNAEEHYTTLTLPEHLVGRRLTLKFELYGTVRSTPVLKAYEVEWMPVGPNPGKIEVSLAALGINQIETSVGVVQNSADFINATLWSLQGANVPYVVQLPYPGPVGHTRRMRVAIVSPGVSVPVLAYTSTLGGVNEAEIPIRLTEV